MANEQLLIIEDDNELGKGLTSALKNDGKTVFCVSTLKDASDQLLVFRPDLILMDVNLPDGNGLDFLKEVKKSHPEIPVIMLTANDTDSDIVRGLELGADDYMTKPFSLSVLRARVNTQLRRNGSRASEELFEVDGYSFDFSNMIFKKGEETFELSKTEQKILRILVANRGMTVKRDHLIDKVWTDGADYVDENALSVSIKRLRDKLGAKDNIKTVYGLGYCWKAEK
ncbi:MAG: response regulator transcription factor [Clostridiales bacterium]|nr:response regulator transcription factor [Clostridiales bacterium]